MSTQTKYITRSMTVGVFRTHEEARHVVSELKRLGFREEEVGIVAKNDGSNGNFGMENDPTKSRWEEGTAIGAGAGAATGVGLGVAVAAGLLTPVGPLIAGGALVALLASAGTGATIGTLFGGLIGLGVSEEDANFYETEVHAGRYLVTVEAGRRGTEVQAVFNRHSGYNRLTSSKNQVGVGA